MGLFDQPWPTTSIEALRQIYDVDLEIQQLALIPLERKPMSFVKPGGDLLVGVIGLAFLGGPAGLLALLVTAYGFGSPVFDIMKMLAESKGEVEIEARILALKVHRQRLRVRYEFLKQQGL